METAPLSSAAPAGHRSHWITLDTPMAFELTVGLRSMIARVSQRVSFWIARDPVKVVSTYDRTGTMRTISTGGSE